MGAGTQAGYTEERAESELIDVPLYRAEATFDDGQDRHAAFGEVRYFTTMSTAVRAASGEMLRRSAPRLQLDNSARHTATWHVEVERGWLRRKSAVVTWQRDPDFRLRDYRPPISATASDPQPADAASTPTAGQASVATTSGGEQKSPDRNLDDSPVWKLAGGLLGAAVLSWWINWATALIHRVFTYEPPNSLTGDQGSLDDGPFFLIPPIVILVLLVAGLIVGGAALLWEKASEDATPGSASAKLGSPLIQVAVGVVGILLAFLQFALQ